ncbi:MAG: ribbon-helix-helix protein, CopG family [Dehalobacter sp. 4CP]|mgnify:CR=1 FL=1|nr:ribbon-helix-helix protein, CopG family [Dehalobacter sp. 4CP]OQB73931.1 MAG: Bifunctional protein PutA [Deltaproteobacteria bacterium ADurb.Bin135]
MSINPIAVKLDPEIRERLKKLAEIKRRSPHWLMKEALREYVEKEEGAEKLRQEAIERWEAYKASGECVSNEAVMAWLDTWGTGNETKRPPCGK